MYRCLYMVVTYRNYDYSFGPVHCPCILKLLCFGELFLSMVHVYLMEIELGQWAKSCRLVLISKSDHCQKTFELTLRYIYIYMCCVTKNVQIFMR